MGEEGNEVGVYIRSCRAEAGMTLSLTEVDQKNRGKC